jgi:FKBP-type peptidyl-prolyl cis-trans isomerase (trigger factor)
MSSSSKPTPTEEQIRQRAYEIYLARGCEDGQDVSDWIQAEQQLSEANEQSVALQKARSAVAGQRR